MSKLTVLHVDDDPEGALRAAAEVLLAGGVVAIPTDTVYGLAAVATKPEAVENLAEMKGRSKSQPIAVLVADADQAESLVGGLSAEATALMDAFWPGPLTIVLPVVEGTANAAAVLSGGETADTTIGIRCPDHRWVRELARRVGPIAATSANLHGMPPCATAEEVVQAFSNSPESRVPKRKPALVKPALVKPALVIDGGSSATAASTVVDCLSSHSKILREGPITQEQIDATLSL